MQGASSEENFLPTERGYEREVVTWAEKHGWLQRKIRYVGRWGALDRMFIREGVVVFIEMKQESGALMHHQRAEQVTLLDHGANAYVCYSAAHAKHLLRRHEDKS